MKVVIEIIERKDLEVFKNTVGYFLEGDGGFLKRRNMYKYSMDYEKIDTQIELTECLKAGTEGDLIDLKNFIIKQKEDYREAIRDAEKMKESALYNLDKLESALVKSNNSNSLWEAFTKIISV